MAISLVAHKQKLGGTTTDAIDTTGATLLVVITMHYDTITDSVSDSKGNTWHNLTQYGNAQLSGKIQIWYAYDHGGTALSVGTGHTFTTASQTYQGLTVLALGGTDATSAVYQASSDHGLAADSAHTVKPGSVTPASAGDIIITGWCDSSGGETTSTVSIDLSFAKSDFSTATSDMCGGVAYLITSTTDAKDPTWTATTTNQHVANIAVFKAASGETANVTPSPAILTGTGDQVAPVISGAANFAPAILTGTGNQPAPTISGSAVNAPNHIAQFAEVVDPTLGTTQNLGVGNYRSTTVTMNW